MQTGLYRIVSLTMLSLTYMLFVFPSFSNGAIIHTEVSAGMQIGYHLGTSTVIDTTLTLTDTLSATVDLDGVQTAGHVLSTWNLNQLDLNAGNGNLNFEYSVAGNDGRPNQEGLLPVSLIGASGKAPRKFRTC